VKPMIVPGREKVTNTLKVVQWSLNLKKNTLLDMIERSYFPPPICQTVMLTYGFSIFCWHFVLSPTSTGTRGQMSLPF
jgi:hypothetical protein